MKTTLGITVSIVMIFAAGGVAHADPNFSNVINSESQFRLQIQGSSIDNDGNFTENQSSEFSFWNYTIDIEEVNRFGDDHLFLDGTAWHRSPSHSCDGAAGQTFDFTASLTSHTSGDNQSHPVTIDPPGDQAHGAHSDSPFASMTYDSGGTNLQGYTITLRILHLGTACSCGDGYVDVGAGEECDDENNNHLDNCRNDCTLPFCGDGITDPDEECDDGNGNNLDNCRNDCTLPFCGDGIVDEGEDCDDGNFVDTDACPNSCTFGPLSQSSLLVNGIADQTGRIIFEVIGDRDGLTIGCAAFSAILDNTGKQTSQRLYDILLLDTTPPLLDPTSNTSTGILTLATNGTYTCRVCEVDNITNCGAKGTSPQCPPSALLGANPDLYGQLWDKATVAAAGVPALTGPAATALALLLVASAAHLLRSKKVS